MTRYTNIGRKRTYVEAGFEDGFQGDAPEPAHQNSEDEPESVPVAGPSSSSDKEKPSAKRRKLLKLKAKKAKQKKLAKIEEPDESGKSEAVESADGQPEQQNEVVKSAYGRANRERLRKNAVTRTEFAERRRLKRKEEKLAATTCFACRERGHAAKDCPIVKSNSGEADAKKAKTTVGICYRCGSTRHSLSRCKAPVNPDDPLPYASCFICSGRGHLASSCPQNAEKGVYPNGGCCKLCSETTHLAKDCPLRKKDTPQPAVLIGSANSTTQRVGADEDDFHALRRFDAKVDSEERPEARAKAKARKQGLGAVGTMTQKPVRSAPPPAKKAKVVNF